MKVYQWLNQPGREGEEGEEEDDKEQEEVKGRLEEVEVKVETGHNRGNSRHDSVALSPVE